MSSTASSAIRRADGALLAAFEREGRRTMGVYRVDGGRLRFQTAITPPADLLARR